MRIPPQLCALSVIALLATGCSTKPRNFTASLSAPVANRSAFQQDYRTCQTLVAKGRKEAFKSAAAQGLAAGAGTIGGTALVTGLGAGVNVGTGAASASFAAVPVIGVLAGFGVSRMIRGGRERKYKRNMSACLTEYGYTVAGWSKLRKKEDAALIAADRVRVVEPELTLGASAEPQP